MFNNSVSNYLYLVRVLAAVSVLLGHGFSFFHLTILNNDQFFPYIQSLAVLIFFLLSGFLTEQSLSKKEGPSYCRFIRGRIKRIYPFFLTALIIVFMIDFVFIRCNPDHYNHYDTFSVVTALKNCLMLPRTVPLTIFGGTKTLELPVLHYLFDNDAFGSARPLWTLFIEWWMYVFYGYFRLVFVKDHHKTMESLDVLILLLFFALFVHLDYTGQCCVLMFVIGCIICRTYKSLKYSGLTAYYATGFLTSVWAVVSLSVRKAYCLEECLLLSCIFLNGLIICEEKKGTSKRPVLKELAAISYPLYLMHYTIMEYIHHNVQTTAGMQMFLAIVFSLIAAVLLFYIVTAFQSIFTNNCERRS